MTYDHWKTTNPDDELFDVPPEIEVACDMCGGEGGIEKWESVSRWSIDPPSAIVIPCENCGGLGFFICEAEGDTSSDMGREAERG